MSSRVKRECLNERLPTDGGRYYVQGRRMRRRHFSLEQTSIQVHTPMREWIVISFRMRVRYQHQTWLRVIHLFDRARHYESMAPKGGDVRWPASSRCGKHWKKRFHECYAQRRVGQTLAVKEEIAVDSITLKNFRWFPLWTRANRPPCAAEFPEPSWARISNRQDFLHDRIDSTRFVMFSMGGGHPISRRSPTIWGVGRLKSHFLSVAT